MPTKTKNKSVIVMKPINKATFERMSIANQRIAICKDVLARMAARKFSLTQGIYCDINGDWSDQEADDRLREAASLKDFLNNPNTNDKNCDVCAKGALVVSWIANFNKYKKDKIYNINHNTLPELRRVFSSGLLNKLEYIFESEAPHKDAQQYFQKAMLNIIENKGVLIWNGITYGKIKAKKVAAK